MLYMARASNCICDGLMPTNFIYAFFLCRKAVNLTLNSQLMLIQLNVGCCRLYCSCFRVFKLRILLYDSQTRLELNQDVSRLFTKRFVILSFSQYRTSSYYLSLRVQRRMAQWKPSHCGIRVRPFAFVCQVSSYTYCTYISLRAAKQHEARHENSVTALSIADLNNDLDTACNS